MSKIHYNVTQAGSARTSGASDARDRYASTFVKMSKKAAARAVPFNFQRLISLTISIISRAIKCGVIRSHDVRCASRITENFDVNREEERERERERQGEQGTESGREREERVISATVNQ